MAWVQHGHSAEFIQFFFFMSTLSTFPILESGDHSIYSLHKTLRFEGWILVSFLRYLFSNCPIIRSLLEFSATQDLSSRIYTPNDNFYILFLSLFQAKPSFTFFQNVVIWLPCVLLLVRCKFFLIQLILSYRLCPQITRYIFPSSLMEYCGPRIQDLHFHFHSYYFCFFPLIIWLPLQCWTVNIGDNFYKLWKKLDITKTHN